MTTHRERLTCVSRRNFRLPLSGTCPTNTPRQPFSESFFTVDVSRYIGRLWFSKTHTSASSISSETRSSQKGNAHPRGSGASSRTTVEDCSIHGQDNPAKGTRAREKNACVDPPRMVEEGKYVRTRHSDGRTCFRKNKRIYLREGERDNWRRALPRLFPLGDRSTRTSRSNYRDSFM